MFFRTISSDNTYLVQIFLDISSNSKNILLSPVIKLTIIMSPNSINKNYSTYTHISHLFYKKIWKHFNLQVRKRTSICYRSWHFAWIEEFILVLFFLSLIINFNCTDNLFFFFLRFFSFFQHILVLMGNNVAFQPIKSSAYSISSEILK